MTRSANDFYKTPPDITRQWIRAYARHMPAPKTILEPAAGDGAMLDPLTERWPEAAITALDISPQDPRVQEGSFYTQDRSSDRMKLYDLVITNPPYSVALQFAQMGLFAVAPGGTLALLMRLGFMASVARASWLKEHMPHHVYVLSRRPSFSGGGSDFSEYAWFVWRENGGRSYAPSWSVL